MRCRALCIFLLFSIHAFSQPKNVAERDSIRAAVEANDSISRQKDISDILKGKFFHAFFGEPDTNAKQQGKLYKSILPNIGYSPATQFIFGVSIAASFYTDKPDSVNLSVLNLSSNYTTKGQIFFPFWLNYWSRKNNFNYPVEFTYFHYPQLTYSLGGESTKENVTRLEYHYILLRLPVLKRIARDFYAGAGYALDYRWKIKILEPPPGEDDYKTYGFSERSFSSGPTLNVLYDSRRNPKNPPKGFYAYIVYRPNLIKLGSDDRWESLVVDVRKYFKLREHSTNVLAFWTYNRLVLSGTPPYLDLPSTGRDTYWNQGRGYIQDRFRGKRLLSLEGEYRFTFSHNGLFGAVVFANVQSVAENLRDKIDNLWPAFGIGFRIKLDKHTNTNLCIDFGVGRGEQGFFGSSGEVF